METIQHLTHFFFKRGGRLITEESSNKQEKVLPFLSFSSFALPFPASRAVVLYENKYREMEASEWNPIPPQQS